MNSPKVLSSNKKTKHQDVEPVIDMRIELLEEFIPYPWRLFKRPGIKVSVRVSDREYCNILSKDFTLSANISPLECTDIAKNIAKNLREELHSMLK